MEVRELRYFVAVFRYGSLTRAAEALHVTQPALSRALRELERRCGVALFDRTPVGMEPTAAARALFPHAKTTLRLADDAEEVARSGAATRDMVEVGLAPGLDSEWLDGLLNVIERDAPEVAISIVDMVSTHQVRNLRQGQLDLGLVHESFLPGLAGEAIRREPLGIAVPPGSPFTSAEPLPLQRLDGVRILAHSRSQVSATYDRLLAATRRLSVQPQWQFGEYTENARAAARAARAHGALMTRSTTRRLMPGWAWRQIVQPDVEIETFLVHAPEPRRVVTRVAQLIRRAGVPGWDLDDGP